MNRLFAFDTVHLYESFGFALGDLEKSAILSIVESTAGRNQLAYNWCEHVSLLSNRSGFGITFFEPSSVVRFFHNVFPSITMPHSMRQIGLKDHDSAKHYDQFVKALLRADKSITADSFPDVLVEYSQALKKQAKGPEGIPAFSKEVIRDDIVSRELLSTFVDIVSKSDGADEGLTGEEFVKMPIEWQIEFCANKVGKITITINRASFS